MKMFIGLFSLMVALGVPLCMAEVVDTVSPDDFEGEIVFKFRGRTVPKTEAVPVNVPRPSREPPMQEAAEPRRLVRYFCKAWKDEDWESLWWAMEPSYRSRVSLKAFEKFFLDDAEATGGLLDENILEVEKNDMGESVKVELIFRYQRAKHRIVQAVVRRVPGGLYRVVPSAIIPVDFDDI